ncbi:Glutamate N-acetyltransferase [Candidatus Rhodobacter oscarellae]|uniref:Arginine biosynthesis bifunctional protein ArgJ n=1 Tax=Candidatus Rhodobacter oscarellae TaxID=1675527 RepID=A0A0J9EBA2_9RHOB|nr:bifunctional glutamate N-acetyltransferase/amino-acid acetyltransferase ArgJ [Candidatus Rhodobacter lobularis]KMW58969.1 Glutamate N-acetyltransferase [Candidatus Rhodobacter lobularis]
MTTPISPLAPAAFPDLPEIAGVRFATAAAGVSAGVKYQGRDDVMLALLDEGTTIAGVFTQSATRSAPVLDCQAKLAKAGPDDDIEPAAILVNSGNANAFTGRAGDESVARLCQAVSEAAGVPADRVYTASTGVIGERLPDERIAGVMGDLVARAGQDDAEAAARAIMTTDTFAKGASTEVDGVKIIGIAKGSGMIAPDMATMLVYIFTDAAVEQSALQDMVSRLNTGTFNCITVDSDTSTSDSLMVAATGKAGPAGPGFEDALHGVMLDLAHQVVRDGEGATKFVEINITGAATVQDGQRAAMAVANSPLVKTAIAGEDPNWGRVVMAVGKSGAAADRDKLSIRFGDILVAENGWVAESYTEEAGAAYMKRDEITISIDLGIGTGTGTAWTCDLTHQYISINADYRS